MFDSSLQGYQSSPKVRWLVGLYNSSLTPLTSQYQHEGLDRESIQVRYNWKLQAISSLSVSDDEEKSKSAEKATNPDNNQPEVVQKKKVNKRTDGHEGARKYLIKGAVVKLIESQGNDPFDYEQKFPEDKQYEELGPAARVWRAYLEGCAAFDIEMVEGWRMEGWIGCFSRFFVDEQSGWSFLCAHGHYVRRASPVPKKLLVRTFREAERESVKQSAVGTDARLILVVLRVIQP
ncbi:hypothetical protein F5146DRAFT_1001774 [Armillaria mellea]|nr:hypothetical protein F5146DRAFT_1001774 [Armillaria mellea]